MNRATRVVIASAVAAAVVFGGVSPSVAALDETRVPGELRLVSPINVDVHDDSYIWSTWRAKKIIKGTTLIMKVKHCNGSWDTRRVPYTTGSFTINVSSSIVAHRYPESAPVKGILVHPDYKRTVTYSGRLPFGSRFGKC